MRTNRNIGIIAASLILGGCIVTAALINQNETVQEKRTAQVQTDSSSAQLLTMEEAAAYLGITEGDIRRIISIESSMMQGSSDIVLEGMMLPYIWIKDRHYFHKESLQKWLMYASQTRRTYDDSYFNQ
ncbi:hypothetical protein DNH61_02760 [Paenibacillus sambharensis]|uniref:Uncharacterized protein n=1 Tax=Paenibacillus sambharensis TaxID=1803190 RepID=A0A2W1LEP1_9BACL|nr:helix-turn-helix domain-containing protein [Paenibacillus sambharensis]PZD97293.1 hypothetical protein DNH61_02760 [Paenibacillus sambharensis]